MVHWLNSFRLESGSLLGQEVLSPSMKMGFTLMLLQSNCKRTCVLLRRSLKCTLHTAGLPCMLSTQTTIPDNWGFLFTCHNKHRCTDRQKWIPDRGKLPYLESVLASLQGFEA